MTTPQQTVRPDAYDRLLDGKWIIRQTYLLRGKLARVLTLKLFGWRVMFGLVRDDPRWTLEPTFLKKGQGK